MRRITIAEFEQDIDAAFDLAEAEAEVVLTRDGRDILRLVRTDDQDVLLTAATDGDN